MRPTPPLSPRLVRQLFVLSLIVFLGYLIFNEIATYLSGVLGAITLYVLLRKAQSILVKRWKWNATLAASTLMTASFVVILLPIIGLALMLRAKITGAIGTISKLSDIVKDYVVELEQKMNIDLSTSLDTEKITSWASDNFQSLLGNSFNVVLAVFLMYFLLYYMLTNRRKMRESLMDYIPLSEGNLKIIGKDSVGLVKSNAIGIPVVAIMQGIIALIGFIIFGVEDPGFWFAITVVGSMIPFVGTALSFVPVCIILWAGGSEFQAVGLGIYGLVVVGATDNIFRLIVLKRLADVHPLITLIGVIIGVPLFGFIGLIFGPILLSLFLLILRIYKKEYGQTSTYEKKEIL